MKTEGGEDDLSYSSEGVDTFSHLQKMNTREIESID